MAIGERRQAFAISKGAYADAGLATLVMLIVTMMIVPLPTWLLDMLIASNLGLSILLLITALYVPHGLAVTSLPSVLLIMTLYRLALNVSSTRLILLQADAGRVIRAFGDFVVRGDYVVGAAVFLIISLIQYLVVAKGGERIAEVAARFTLDAMPGKQLAIDADLRTGALRVEAARERRVLLERESQFYGAMDGAMKFVKGDAIATLVITAIALTAGAAIGFGSRGLSLPATLQLYGLLAIGDGLVSQLPALVTSIAAGLVVTRVATQGQTTSLGEDLVGQLFARPRAFAAASACLLAMAIVPGLPAIPFLVLSLSAAALAVRLQRVTRARLAAEGESGSEGQVLAVELGRELAAEGTGLLAAALERETTRLNEELGVPMPRFRIVTRAQLDPRTFIVRLREAPVLRGRARSMETVVELVEAELSILLVRRARDLVGLDDVQRMLDSLAERAPALVRSVVPRPLTLPQLCEVLRRLLDEGVSVHAFERIVECLASTSERELGVDRGLDQVRRALKDELTEKHLREGVLSLHRIDPLIEDAVRDATLTVNGERVVGLAPDLVRDVVEAVRRARGQHGEQPVLLTQPDIRRTLRDLLVDELPEVTVLSFAELPAGVAVEEREAITV
jgi:type III secretion protein V